MSSEAFPPREKLVEPDQFGVVEDALWRPFPRAPWPEKDDEGRYEPAAKDDLKGLWQVEVAYLQHRFVCRLNATFDDRWEEYLSEEGIEGERTPDDDARSDEDQPAFASRTDLLRDFARKVGDSYENVQAIVAGRRPIQLRQLLLWTVAYDEIESEEYDRDAFIPSLTSEDDLLPPSHLVQQSASGGQ